MKEKIYTNKIEEVMSSAMKNIRSLVDVDVVVGNSILNNSSMQIFPLTKVTMGFVAGGGEYNVGGKDIKSNIDYPFTGGSGAGVSVQPIAFLVVENNDVYVVKIDSKSALDRLIEVVPEVANFITKNFSKKNEKCEN